MVDQVCAEWYEFGMLGFSLNQLKMWDAEYRGNAKRGWNEVMEQWLTQGGSGDYPAMWEGLYNLLRDTGFRNIARKVENAVFRHSS